MTINVKIRDEKLQYDINREAARISVLSSEKNDKHEYLPREEILDSNRRHIIKKLSLLILLSEKFLKNKHQNRLMFSFF